MPNFSGLWTSRQQLQAAGASLWPTRPGAPTIGTATAGNASASVAFTAPSQTGYPSSLTYTATSSPGGFTGTGSSSPISVTGLTNGTSYTFTVTATNATGTGPVSAASNSVTPAVPVAAWNEAGSGSTQTALIDNLLFAGIGNTVYQFANVAPLVKNNTNPKSTSGLNIPSNYSLNNTYTSNVHGMTTSAPSQFSSANGYGMNSFRVAKAAAPGLHAAWSGTPNPGIACCWFYIGSDGMHFLGNADCTSRYLLDNHPTNSAWRWIVIDLFNNTLYWDNVSQGNAGGTYTNLFCSFYMGWTNGNTVDAYYHDYRVYQYDAANHSAMVSALRPVPSTAYYTGGL